MQRAIGLQISKHPELLETVKQYNQIVNEHIGKCFELKTNSKNKLHKTLYQIMRKKYPNFPSPLIQCARDNAVEMLKGNKYKANTQKRLEGSIRFDLRTCKVFLESGQLQLTTVDGRKKYGVKVSEYFSKYFNWKVKGVTLGVDRKFLKIKVVVEGEKPKQSGEKVLGIDLGIKNFAVLSNGTFVKPHKIRAVKRRYAYLRSMLQSKGTRSAKRHLKLLAGRERRFMTDFNHVLSKKVAELHYGTFALEELKGIRNGNKGKMFNRMRSNWAYFQLRQLLTYKAEERGKAVLLVDPRYTSQKCSNCGFVDKSNRKRGTFCCQSCGFYCSADLNASINISHAGAILCGQAAVNQPIVTANERRQLQAHAMRS